jgi:hypothetical protein
VLTTSPPSPRPYCHGNPAAMSWWRLARAPGCRPLRVRSAATSFLGAFVGARFVDESPPTGVRGERDRPAANSWTRTRVVTGPGAPLPFSSARLRSRVSVSRGWGTTTERPRLDRRIRGLVVVAGAAGDVAVSAFRRERGGGWWLVPSGVVVLQAGR